MDRLKGLAGDYNMFFFGARARSILVILSLRSTERSTLKLLTVADMVFNEEEERIPALGLTGYGTLMVI